MFFESHAHYDDRRYDADRDELLTKILPEAGISNILNIGSRLQTSRRSVALAKKYDYIYATVGVHPHYAKEITSSDLKELKRLSREPKVVAWGEIGLDFHYNHSHPDIQRQRFIEQLDMACELKMPVIIHSRDADYEVYNILEKAFKEGRLNGGVIHCFSSNLTMAKKYIDLGLHIGIGGVVTYKKSDDLQNVALNIPLSSMLIETDCPYLSPEPHRGQRNDSQNLRIICTKIAELRGDSLEKIAEATRENAKNLFLSKKY